MIESIGRVPGFYIFPGMGLRPDATKGDKHAAIQQFEQKVAMYSPALPRSCSAVQAMARRAVHFVNYPKLINWTCQL
jgi:hypothetical protein